ncbi:olfactory receptor 6N2-like [Xyrichtys novacula]|uniref:Olfactory receptor n=1 Tax=Xyrichtys novacula TaxID=13765 RepID=A0AAV1GXL8_XYRNO|nr:olfactory receptor 6N2-like [Xyrichtys novacula]
MDAHFNQTVITLGGHVDVNRYRYLYFFIMLTVFILILCFNITIVFLICKHKSLHEPMYVFIAALLLNSALFSAAVYPKFLMDYMSEKQIISYPACLFQFYLLYSLSGSEFLLLAAMAYDRYVSICEPLRYPTIMRRTTVSVFLALAWLVPACQTAVSVILSAEMKLCNFTLEGVFCNNLIYALHCERSTALSAFGLFALVDSGLLPMLFILFTYTRILLISYRSCKEVRKKAAQTCLPHLLVLISFSCFCAFDILTTRVGADFSKTVRLIITLQAVLYHPLFNPIIYGLKMREISKQLRRLLCQAQVCSCIR